MNNLVMICVDCIRLVVQFIPYKHLLAASKASPIIHQMICEQGTRIICSGFKHMRLMKDDIGIKCGEYNAIIRDEHLLILRRELRFIYSKIRYIDYFPDHYSRIYCDPINLMFIIRMNDGVHYLINIDKIIIEDDVVKSYCKHFTKILPRQMIITAQLNSSTHLGYCGMYVDMDTKIILAKHICQFSVMPFKVIWSDEKWIA